MMRSWRGRCQVYPLTIMPIMTTTRLRLNLTPRSLPLPLRLAPRRLYRLRARRLPLPPLARPLQQLRGQPRRRQHARRLPLVPQPQAFNAPLHPFVPPRRQRLPHRVLRARRLPRLPLRRVPQVRPVPPRPARLDPPFPP